MASRGKLKLLTSASLTCVDLAMIQRISSSMPQFLAISGSLRRESSNTALLQAAAIVAPDGTTVSLYTGLGDLPPFNPDLEGKEPLAVLDFRTQLKAADGILISSPEYAHGVSGVLKNALDWVVSSGEFSGKPVAIFNASPRASLAQESLAEIVRTMDARLLVAASISVPLLGKKWNAATIAEDAGMAAELVRSLQILSSAVG